MNWVNVVINGREVSVAFDENSIHIYNAFPIKDDLKLRGYRWNPSDKSWFINPADIDAEMEVLKNDLKSAPLPVKQGKSKELAHLPESYSVADLRNRIDRLIREGIRGNIWVRGVIASDVKHYDWKSYLDLKDEDENRNIFFRVEVKKNNLEKIQTKLKESGVAQSLEKDLPVFCNVDVHLPLQNVVDIRLSLLDILPEYTQARIRNQREITLEKLKEEGILENQKRLILPALISRIGLITSEQGTSIKDIHAGLHPYGDKYRFYFVDSRMEGAGAVDSIIRALAYLENESDLELDAVIIARGGGSEQSLAVFNDLQLCRRVCLSRFPVITAIGHEKDVSAIEMCSCLTPTPSTPSGVGKYLQNRYVYLQDQLSATVTQLIHRFTTVHQREMGKIGAFLKNIPARAAAGIRLKRERFFSLARSLERSVSFMVRDHERRINVLSGQLVKRYYDLHTRQEKNIGSLTETLLSRGRTLHLRELKLVEKTISRLDFEKRERDNLKQEQDISKRVRDLFHLARKLFSDNRKDLEARTRLVNASDPRNILEKGFTLTLDEENRIVKSLEAFERLENGDATLQFHDGTVPITKRGNNKR
jgi:exodeoxyribonuclease VII large subunit